MRTVRQPLIGQSPRSDPKSQGFQTPATFFALSTIQMSCCDKTRGVVPSAPSLLQCIPRAKFVGHSQPMLTSASSPGASPHPEPISRLGSLRPHLSFGGPTSKANRYISLSDSNSLGKINKQLGPETKDCWLLREAVQELQNLS